ncbi:MAG: adenosylmethionine--8-amino-7-oxononanoate transaminase [Acidimicrobiales bacterium]|nr:adenosylmethionine--8-amino-7-oxononanoate transaminase [Acidimicrobiales bacterium]
MPEVTSSEALLSLDARHLWHPYAAVPNRSPVLPVVGADGVRLELADGTRLIDGMSSWWAAIHGYNHPTLNAAVAEQTQRMSHVMFGGLTHPSAVTLAERLLSVLPDPLAHVFYTDSGSVAVEVAIKMALQYWMGAGMPAKQRLLTVRGGYHGDTFAAMSVCDPETGMHHLFGEGILPRQIFAERPEPAFGQPFDDGHMDSVTACLESHAEEIAAVIIEPVVQGAGGMRFYSPEYVRRLRDLCDAYQVLLIADEIATGFGRSGALFAIDHAGVCPDILCLGKAMTGGYLSMAATLCTAAVADGVCAAPPGALLHGPTFMGNPLASAVAVASIDLLLSQPWQAKVRHVQEVLGDGLGEASTLPGVVDVRVLGAIGVLEMREPVPTEVAHAVVLERGVWLRPFGRLLYTMPPYITDDADLHSICSAMTAIAARMQET